MGKKGRGSNNNSNNCRRQKFGDENDDDIDSIENDQIITKNKVSRKVNRWNSFENNHNNIQQQQQQQRRQQQKQQKQQQNESSSNVIPSRKMNDNNNDSSDSEGGSGDFILRIPQRKNSPTSPRRFTGIIHPSTQPSLVRDRWSSTSDDNISSSSSNAAG